MYPNTVDPNMQQGPLSGASRKTQIMLWKEDLSCGLSF